MSPGEWSTIAGIVIGAAGAVWGWAFATGRYKSKIDGQGKMLDQIVRDFAECQRRGTECTASTRILLDAAHKRMLEMQADIIHHKAAVHQHHERQDIHTTEEWRKNVFERLDRMEEMFDRKLQDQTKTLVGRIESVERAVRNGK